MNVLITCKYEEDLIKNEGARMVTTLYSNFSDAQVVFPPAQKKGMVKFPKKGTFSARRHAKRALSSMRGCEKGILNVALEIQFDHMHSKLFS